MGVLSVVIFFDCALAWRNGRAPRHLLSRIGSEEEGSALPRSEEIWLSDMTAPTEASQCSHHV
jgi:hypothetical protein